MDYQKLAADEFRLVVLRQGPEYTNIEMSSMPRVSLSNIEDTEYIALSYTWGTADDHQTIFVDGAPLRVTRNLAAFLWHFRKELDPGNCVGLWIDAICIDQEDAEDKNQQLLLMRRIYESAKSTLIWLGPATDGVGKAVDLITMTSEKACDGEESRLDRWLSDETNQPLFMDSLVALASLLSRSWFSRIWVVQEVILAQSILMRCGSYPLSLVDAFEAAKTLEFHPIAQKAFEKMVYNHPDLMEGVANVFGQLGYVIDAWNNKTFEHESDALLTLLLRYRGKRASDPRDKIYALLGILEVGSAHSSQTPLSAGYDPHFLLTDYDASVADVYKSLVRSIVTATNKLDVICASHGLPRSFLPSWTPDWSQPWLGENLLYKEITNHHPFRASGEKPSQVDFLDISRGIIRAKGLIIDEIGEIWPYLDFDDDSSTGYLERTREWRRQENHGIYKDKDSANDAFWRSMVGNLSIDWKDPPEEWATAFENWMTGDVTIRYPLAINRQSLFNRANGNRTGRRTAVSESKRYIALVPDTALAGDLICVLFGCSLPVILRKSSNGATDHGEFFEFVGESYVHGIMSGEALEGIELRQEELVNFELR